MKTNKADTRMFRGTCIDLLECVCFMFLANFTMYVGSARGCRGKNDLLGKFGGEDIVEEQFDGWLIAVHLRLT